MIRRPPRSTLFPTRRSSDLRPGLFHCYAVPDLPRTNNGLEQLFGSQRYHERRATGRKAASPAAVLRGEVRLIAATATRLCPPRADRKSTRLNSSHANISYAV